MTYDDFIRVCSEYEGEFSRPFSKLPYVLRFMYHYTEGKNKYFKYLEFNGKQFDYNYKTNDFDDYSGYFSPDFTSVDKLYEVLNKEHFKRKVYEQMSLF